MIRPTLRRLSILGYLSATALSLLGVIAPLAHGGDAREEFQKAVAAQINEIVTKDVETYFRQLHLEEPVNVETTTDADIDTSDTVPRVTKITLNVNVVTDQPSQVVRQARHRLVRLLREQGYRFESGEGIQVDTMPLAVLNIQTTPPPKTQAESEQTWVYAGFAGIIIALLTSLATLLYILFLPWIRWHRARKAHVRHPQEASRHEPNVQDLPPFPTPPGRLSQAVREPNPMTAVELPPLPPILNVVDSSASKHHGRASSIEVGGWSTLSQPD